MVMVHHRSLCSLPLNGGQRVGDGGVGEDVMTMVMMLITWVVMIVGFDDNNQHNKMHYE